MSFLISTTALCARLIHALRALQGEALDAEVQETKLHQERHGVLAAELERLRHAHNEADRAHQAMLAELEPKRRRHSSLKVWLSSPRRSTLLQL